jgi:CPA1 family monovalent cation:H+ antiporter
MASATLILSLLLLVAISGMLARFIRFVPLPLLQVALGVMLAWPARGVHVGLDPELFLLVFIPPLLFLDGYLAPKREFVQYRVPIVGYAFGLVIFTVVLFGYALHWILPAVPLPVAFALAAVLSPTDAVAVSSIVDRRRIPARLIHILQGESLLNDASGLVVFRIAIAARLTGHFSLGRTAVSFVLVALGGVAAGIACLWITARVLRFVARIGDIRPEVQVLVLLLLPFAAYLLAEHFHASGVLAAVTAGLQLGRSGLFGSMSVPARLTNRTLIEFLSFVFNGAIFLLLGLQLPEIIRHVPLGLSLSGKRSEPIIVDL